MTFAIEESEMLGGTTYKALVFYLPIGKRAEYISLIIVLCVLRISREIALRLFGC